RGPLSAGISNSANEPGRPCGRTGGTACWSYALIDRGASIHHGWVGVPPHALVIGRLLPQCATGGRWSLL
ncbi:MAG: hypothetical protein V3U46_08170, partial [Acidimicrobiia bacterium]